ncbi:MAG: glycosyltransferase, partial [Anaerolineae bacterium]
MPKPLRTAYGRWDTLNKRDLANNGLFVITANRIPSERANANQTLKMAEAMTLQGWQVTLLAPRRRNRLAMRELATAQAVWDYYQVQAPFLIRFLPCWDSRWLNRRAETWWFPLISLTFAFSLALYLIGRGWKDPPVLYTREERFAGHLLAWLKPVLRMPVFFESHRFPPTQRNLRWQRRMDGIVTISNHLRMAYLEAGFQPDRVLTAPDGVDLRLFSDLPARDTARAQLGLPLSRPVVVYTGHLFRWKGVYTLAKAAQHLPDVLTIFVGGMERDVQTFRAFVREMGVTNVQVLGHASPTQVPLYLAAADVLILPNSAKEDISRLYTSPLKLFEYMASGRPIV